MPVIPNGRATLLQGCALILICLRCPIAEASEPPFAAPGESVGLPAVVEWDCARCDEGKVDQGPLSSVFGEDDSEKAISGVRYAEWTDNLWTSHTELLPPVVRAQSTDVELLPLSFGEPQIESTSLLRWVTGTRGRLRADYLTDFDDVDRIGGHVLTQTWLGFGLDAEVNRWQRPVVGSGQQPFWTGDLNLMYNAVPHPRMKFRSGIGGAWTYDEVDLNAGYNISHGLDVYLLWRAMFTGEIEWGKIRDDKLFRYRVALGLTIKSAELFTGYESYELGSEHLDGWVNGVAIWY